VSSLESGFILLLEEGELFLIVLLGCFAGERVLGHNVGCLFRISTVFGLVHVDSSDRSVEVDSEMITMKVCVVIFAIQESRIIKIALFLWAVSVLFIVETWSTIAPDCNAPGRGNLSPTHNYAIDADTS